MIFTSLGVEALHYYSRIVGTRSRRCILEGCLEIEGDPVVLVEAEGEVEVLEALRRGSLEEVVKNTLYQVQKFSNTS